MQQLMEQHRCIRSPVLTTTRHTITIDFLFLQRTVVQCWTLLFQANITEEAMRQGVFDADVFILFLTNSVLSRPFCLMEIGWALEFRKPVLVVTEMEERFWPFDLTRWQEDRCTRVHGEAVSRRCWLIDRLVDVVGGVK